MIQTALGSAPGIPGAAAMVADVCTLLSELLGRKVASKKIPPCCVNAGPQRIITCYEDEKHSLVAILICDLALAAYAGAALAMIPADVAKESLAGGPCEQSLMDNFYEILNICRQLFQKSSPHILAPTTYLNRRDLPPEITALLTKPKSRLDAELAIPGYGNGQITILFAV